MDLGFIKPAAETRIVVAMSGGVDSSVVAALLKEQGYDVIGMTLQLYDHGAAVHRPGACCAGQDILDARRTAARLGIPHYVLDYEARFKDKVIGPFAKSYAAGETPVPCVACNSEIKFADLLETARDLGAEALATGHYVGLRRDSAGEWGLYRADDLSRDQSYFMFATTKEQLSFLRFPLGEMEKPQVREAARRFGLPVADKADSQDICFVPSGKYSDLVKRLSPGAGKPGEIVHVDGRVLGRHPGVIHYTVGQRRGLGLGGSPHGEPLFVVKLDAARALVVVGPHEALATSRIHLRAVNWIGPGSLEEQAKGREIFVKIRSSRPPVQGLLEAGLAQAEVTFAIPEHGVSPGQACVIYDSDGPRARVLGGGFIVSTEPVAPFSHPDVLP
ncbi:MAG TPA: tRNA 2-thiouridine(34) synthase MnmA [Methylocella sp.]|nr:tRNA 2-thiouridine(34) synthase MnmA [Methylocella sp.]